jgi:hypothetical protein
MRWGHLLLLILPAAYIAAQWVRQRDRGEGK